MAYTFRHGDRPLEGFTIQRAVGRGGFGEVYYALSDGGREVALKYLRENPSIELRGISYCMNLKSPHLVSIFDVKANAQGEYFVVMEYVAGPSLRDLLLAEPNGIGPQKAAFFIREIAKGLAYLHDRGIVHRDLKPGNIFYDEGYVKIGDYGLSKFISVSRHSAQTASIGTVHYMAPEVGSGNYHRGIDLYALGVMLYEMLLGRVPFEGSSMGEVLMKHLTAQPEVDDLPAPFGKVIRKALQKDPAERYQTIYELVDDLLEVEDVQHSLAGFNPQSLAGVERRGSAEPLASPAPSPNPAPRRLPVPAADAAYDMDARPLPPKLAQRLASIGERVDKRVQRLDAKHGRKTPPDVPPARPARAPARAPLNAIRSKADFGQRVLLAVAMAVAMGLGFGFLTGCREEGLVSSVLMLMGMAGGVALGARGFAHLSRHSHQPRWLERICLTVPAAVLLGIGVVPLSDRIGEEHALGVWFALLITTFLVDWREHAETGRRGSMSVWQAGKVGLLALIATAILTSGFRHVGALNLFGGGIGMGTSLLVQALGWLFPLSAWFEGVTAPAAASAPPQDFQRGWRGEDAPLPARTIPEPASAAPSLPGEAPSFVMTGPPRRRLITRLLAGLVFVGALGGSTVAAVWLAMEAQRSPGDEVVLAWTLLGAGVGLVLAAGRKLSAVRTGGFYRDTARPALMTLVLGGLALCLSRLSMGVAGDPNEALCVISLVLLAMMFLFLLVKRGRRLEGQMVPVTPGMGYTPEFAGRSAPDAAPTAR